MIAKTELGRGVMGGDPKFHRFVLDGKQQPGYH
jgi:hypothetical protein